MKYLNKFKWQVKKDKNTCYATRWISKFEQVPFKGRHVTMHKYIFFLKGKWDKLQDKEIDHKDSYGLNNQYNNLRIATKNQNQHNTRVQINNQLKISEKQKIILSV